MESIFMMLLKIVLPSVATIVIGIIGEWFRRALVSAKKNGIANEAYEALEAGVARAEDDFAAWAKKASKDGKLSKTERSEAHTIAIDVAKQVATGPALKWLLSKSSAYLVALIKGIVRDNKNNGG